MTFEEIEDDSLEHIGIIRRSGRYPWGSGGDSYERSVGFKSYLDEMRSKGLTDPQIVEGIQAHLNAQGSTEKFKTPDLRAAISLSTEEIFGANQALATRLKEKGMGTSAIARRMSTDDKKVNESTVRGWLKNADTIKADSNRATAEALKSHVEEKEFLDVGKGTHLHMGVSDVRLNTALALLREEGYGVHSNIKVPQLGTDKLTNYKVLSKNGGPNGWHEARLAVRAGKLKVVPSQSDDGGLTFHEPKNAPISVNSKRIQVRYGPEGGKEMDGVIELRRGVDDISLGANKYAQVRVAVDGSHYLKGMAMYADDLPNGVDIRFNTNKEKTGSKLNAMKPMKMVDGKVDVENPFGATTYPKVYTDKKGKEKTSALRMVNEEGRWDEWSKSLSSQFLSKQSHTLAKQQLAQAFDHRKQELDAINSLTNKVVKRKLLAEYADSADAAAVHLKAAALPRQATHVILPINSIRRDEIYAPKFTPGEKVILVRHPHGGPFEIPELTVNNNNRLAKRILGDAADAVGIHHSVADQLSGADFDGDTVLVIPNDSRKVKNRPPLAALKGFDPKREYGIPEGNTTIPRMSKKNTQTEMGKISNLITDMTIRGATDAELAKAVKHSMVVIDAEKHGLNYKQSERDNGISQLKRTYQGGPTKGAATLISRSSSAARIPEVKQPSGPAGINRKTGEKILNPTGATRTRVITKVNKRTGEVISKTVEEPKTTKGTRMEFAKDARELLSTGGGTPMERIYADHANSMKALANAARKENVSLVMPKQSPTARRLYAKEVATLDAKLKEAQRNAPLERRAQVIGNGIAKARIDNDPTLDKDQIKKIKYQELERARIVTGASKKKIGTDENPLTEREWEAIQSGAVSHTKLGEILANAHMPRIRELATPRPRTSLSTGQVARARALLASGKSLTTIAEQLGIPRTTLSENLKQ